MEKETVTSSTPADSASPDGERPESEVRGALTWAVFAWAAAVLCSIAALVVCAINGYGPAIFTDSTAPAQRVASIGIICLCALLNIVAAFVVRKHPVAAFICSAWCSICAVAVWSFIPVTLAKVFEIVAIALTAAGLLVSLPAALDSSEKKHRDFF